MRAVNVGSLLIGASLLLTSSIHVVAFEDHNETENLMPVIPVEKNGRVVYINEYLLKKLEDESETSHWSPWLRTRLIVVDDIVRERECLSKDSIESFPDGLFDDNQLRQGAFILYAIFGLYSFTLLAIVCNDYFIPCVEIICEELKIPQNIAAATFMSVATSCPEFFVNLIATFLTESDMGIGTIVGSAIFNALGVAAVGGLAAISPIVIEKRPVTRDVIVYMINVSVLVVIVWDGQIDWYESVVLGILYILYFVFMFNSMKLFALYDKLADKMCKNGASKDRVSVPVVNNDIGKVNNEIGGKSFSDINNTQNKVTIVDKEEEAGEKLSESIWRYPKEKSLLHKIWWLYTWPLKLLLKITIPSPVTCRNWYPMGFFMCIVWIGANSYCVSWSMTVLGHTFLIPESVMGMTFLAFGGCLPEACSIYIMSRRGEGGIGVSNALGANSLAILFAMGLPWLIKTLTLVFQGADQTAVLINSSGIDFVIGSLLVAVTCLWITLFFGKFTLRPRLGFVLLFLYLIFITFAILVEMDVILDRSIVIC